MTPLQHFADLAQAVKRGDHGIQVHEVAGLGMAHLAHQLSAIRPVVLVGKDRPSAEALFAMCLFYSDQKIRALASGSRPANTRPTTPPLPTRGW